MRSKGHNLLWLPIILFSCSAMGQAVPPVEITDPALRDLQQACLDDLRTLGQEITTSKFPHAFYLSRKLDIDEHQQQAADQRSIRFDHFNGKTVLAITGNYYAAYPADKFNDEQRAHETFLNVVLPILNLAVPRFQNNKNVEGYALEISHHILGKVMNVSMERPENLVVFLPQHAALKLLSAKDDNARQAGLLEGQTMLNAVPVTIWLNGQGPQLTSNNRVEEPPSNPIDSGPQAAVEIAPSRDSGSQPNAPLPAISSAPKPKEAAPVTAPPRDTSPQALATLHAADAETVAKMLKELDPQAHFVSYAPPSFVAFRQGVYLELSLRTVLPESAAGSRYKMAALAFDDHIAHLIRPILGYFKDESKFDGLSFSTSVSSSGRPQGPASKAVEFFFPFSALRCYERYDCTGQQLIDAGTVLINGERVSLELQTAEGASGR